MAFNDDEKPHTSNTGSTKGLVTIKPVKYFKDDAALTADTVTAELEINAKSSTTVREGLDLVAVLDVSGGMDGEKMETVKKAMAFVTMKLTPVDRLSIVTFSDVATRLSPLRSMTPAAQNDLRALVDGLQANGGTNIQAGLETGLAVIAERVHTKARTANIFLVSGGHQTSGDARQVNPVKVATIYTFGLGIDTDLQLMSDIAEKSPGGTFRSVPDGSKASLPFSQMISGLLTVVAQDVELTITPRTEEGDVDTIEVARGTEYTTTTDASSGVITVKFGTLFAGEGRKVLVTLKLKDVSATTTSEEYDATLAHAQHSFTAQGKVRDPQVPQDIQIRRTPTPSQSPEGEDEDDGRKLVETLRAELLQLIRLMDTQQLYEAKARLHALASETSHGLQRYAARGGDDDGGVRVFATPRMDAYLEQAKNFEGRPYALASEIFHGRQRYAARGGDDDDDDGVRLFATPRMDVYLEQAKNFEGRPYALASETTHGRQRFAARGGDEEDEVRLFATPRMDAYLEQAKNFEKDPTAPVPSADEDVKQELAAISTELST